MNKPAPQKGILAFLVIELVLVAVFSTAIILDGRGLEANFVSVLCIMFSPALTALVVNLVVERNLKGFGWGWGTGGAKYYGISYLLPLLYIAVPYGITLALGLVSLNSVEVAKVGGLEVFQLLFANVLLLCLIVAGEEIGWRGYLLPQLCKVMSFDRASFVVGMVWIAVHVPILLFSDYNASGAPVWFRLTTFVVLALGVNLAINWLRMKSLSLWPAVLLHATHNSVLQDLKPLFAETTASDYLLSESGLVLALAGVVVGLVFWAKRREVSLS